MPPALTLITVFFFLKTDEPDVPLSLGAHSLGVSACLFALTTRDIPISPVYRRLSMLGDEAIGAYKK